MTGNACSRRASFSTVCSLYSISRPTKDCGSQRRRKEKLPGRNDFWGVFTRSDGLTLESAEDEMNNRNKRLPLISNSTLYGSGYLDHAESEKDPDFSTLARY